VQQLQFFMCSSMFSQIIQVVSLFSQNSNYTGYMNSDFHVCIMFCFLRLYKFSHYFLSSQIIQVLRLYRLSVYFLRTLIIQVTRTLMGEACLCFHGYTCLSMVIGSEVYQWS
jgi:hypothetical protein